MKDDSLTLTVWWAIEAQMFSLQRRHGNDSIDCKWRHAKKGYRKFDSSYFSLSPSYTHAHEHTHTPTHEHTHSITPTRFLAVLPTSKILDLQYDFGSSVTPRLLTERQPLASCFMISRENGMELLSYPLKLAMVYSIALGYKAPCP